MEYDEITLGDDPFSKRVLEHPNFKRLEDTLRIAYCAGDYKPYEEYAGWAYLRYSQEKKLSIKELVESMRKEFIEHCNNLWVSTKAGCIYIGGPICGHIDELGNIILSDGHHRIALLRIQGKLIKMRVISRADGWVLLKEAMLKVYGKKQTYQRFAHPDLVDWTTVRGEDREDKIRPYIYGNVVNLGSAEGWLDYKLSKFSEGWLAYENHPIRGKLAELQLAGTKARLIKEDFYDASIPECDCLLLMSTFHHLYRLDKQKATWLLERIGQLTKRFIFEVANKNEPLWGDDIPEMPEYVLKNTTFKRVIEIDSPRKIMVFEK